MTPDIRKKRGLTDDDDVMSSSSTASSIADKSKARKTPAQVKAEAAARKAKVRILDPILRLLNSQRQR
jgi:hypothetical protein